ncbi:hypothetical protein [Chryseosolibacter indicus]|uniref:DUF1795 domain-containing protein n=1 Tax=Chryseosolibacter indicus TaxID=2782351 RepID=A0ABS5VNR2_9BACT|nr:hypothetical protein [Chryseosolibacter indicus]MBT1703092.1 hypothetical protein [Chryseosolibacter indicus]
MKTIGYSVTMRWVLCSLVFVLSNCKNEKLNFVDKGVIEDGFYSNKFFNFSLSIPEQWVVQNFDTATNADTATSQVITLLTISKYHPAATEDFNPSFNVIAERLSKKISAIDEKSYLQLTLQQLQKTGLYKSFDGNGTIVKLGAREFYSMKVVSKQSITQEFFVSTLNDHMLVFITSYENDQQKSELDAVLGSITGF